MAKPLMRPFRIWYDGLDAAENQMDIETLGESLRGVGQILRASSHFSFRHEYNKRRDTAYVRILVEPPRPGTWWCDAIAVAASQTPLLSLISTPVFWETTLSVAKATLFKRAGRQDLNDRLMDSLEKSLDAQTRALDAQSEAIRVQASATENLVDALKFQAVKDARTVDSLLATVNRLIDNHQPSARRAVTPIGVTCSSMRLGANDDEPTIDDAMATAIRSQENLEVLDEREYLIRLDGITLHTRSCKFEFVGQEGVYVNGRITDPELMLPENKYTNALDKHLALRVRAKETIKDGELHQLHISDARVA